MDSKILLYDRGMSQIHGEGCPKPWDTPRDVPNPWDIPREFPWFWASLLRKNALKGPPHAKKNAEKDQSY